LGRTPGSAQDRLTSIGSRWKLGRVGTVRPLQFTAPARYERRLQPELSRGLFHPPPAAAAACEWRLDKRQRSRLHRAKAADWRHLRNWSGTHASPFHLSQNRRALGFGNSSLARVPFARRCNRRKGTSAL